MILNPQLSTSDVAQRMGTTVPHVRKLAREGKLPHFRIGGLLRFDQAEIEAWLEADYNPVAS